MSAITAIITQEAALNRATIVQTSLSGSKLRLLQTITPNASTNLATFVANECNFTGYPAGGYNLSNWTGPALSPTGGGVISAASVTVAPAANLTVSNAITGGWVETAANTVLSAFGLNPPAPATAPTDQFQIALQDTTNPT